MDRVRVPRLIRACAHGGSRARQPVGPRSVAPAVVWRRVAWIAVAALFAAGCLQAAPATPAHHVRDSAGVEIVENHSPVSSSTWTVTADPVLDIAPEHTGEADQAIGLAEGGMIVLSRFPPHFRVFDSSGSPVGAFGQRGDGPGEYRTVTWFQVSPGDSLFVFDAGLMRVTVSNVAGEPSRMVSVRSAADGSGLPLSGRAGRFSDGSLLAVPSAYLAPRGGRPEGVAYRNLMRVTEDGSIVADLGRFPHFQYVSVSRRARVPALFGAQLAHVVSSRDRVLLGFGDTFKILELDLTGQVSRIIRKSHRSARIRGRHIEEAIRRAGYEHDDNARRILESRVSAEEFPAYGPEWLIDRMDRLWVPDARPSGTMMRSWFVFASDGRWLKRVDLPREFEPTDADRGHVTGVWTEPRTRTTSVRRYALRTETSSGVM